jgi:hypothetical protein
MLPLFILMFASIYLMHGHFVGRQQAMARARSCVWAYAMKGCPDQEPDKRRLRKCLDPPNGVRAKDADVKSDDEENPDRYTDAPADRVGDVLDKVGKIPALGGAVRWLFGKPVEAKAVQEVRLPAYTLPKQDRFFAAAKYYTMCNSVPKDWGQVGKDIFCSFVGKGTFGC